MWRVAAGLIALSLLTGFAPAPFPKKDRVPEGLSLASCQATWTVVKKESISGNGKALYNSGISHIRIRGDRWILLNDGKELATYRITIDGTKKPGEIDWYPNEDRQQGQKQATLWVGAIKREGNELLVMYSSSRPTDRPVSFENPPSGWYLYTLRR